MPPRPNSRTAFSSRPTWRSPSEYLSRIIEQELAAVGRPPFFHIGSDETATLGLGQTQQYVAQRGRSQAYADHIVAMNRLIAPSGARVMLWDDGIENDPAIMRLIPSSAVIVNWHYGDEASFEPYIKTIASGGFEQMVAPGASNWNEIYPNVDRASRNETRFIDQGKAAGVLGLLSNGLARRRRDALRSDVVSGDLRGRSGMARAATCRPSASPTIFRSAFFGAGDPSL